MIGVEDQAQRKKKGKRGGRKKKKREVEGHQGSQQRLKSYKQPARNAQLFKNKTLKVKQRKIGLIIGRGGCHIKALYERTHCDIILPRPTKKAKQEYADDTVDYDDDNADIYYQYDAYTDSVQTNLKINDDDQKQKDDKSENKNDEGELDEDDPERMVEVKLRGTPEELRDAEFEINFMIKNGRLMMETEREGGNDKKRRNRPRKKKKAEYDNDNDEDDDCAEDLRIPSKICGMLIGGGGQRVKEIADDTGCEIWVDWDKESHIEAGVSIVHLSGTQYAIELAKVEIRRIMELFEKRAHKIAFELPSFCSKTLFEDHGKLLKKLQQEFGVTITIRNDQNRNRYIRIGQEHQRVQSTMMVLLIGEKEDSLLCKREIIRLVGHHRKCDECEYLTKETDGHMDEYGGSFYCNRCWDEFNGITTAYKKNLNNNNNNNVSNAQRRPPSHRMNNNVSHATNKMNSMDLNPSRNNTVSNAQRRPPHKNNYDQSYNRNQNDKPRRPPMKSNSSQNYYEQTLTQEPHHPRSNSNNYKYGYNKIDESQPYLGQQRRSRKVGRPSVERNNKW